MRERSAANGGKLPTGIPEEFEGLSVTSRRNGKAGYVLFTLLDSFSSSLDDLPVKVEIEYHLGYTRIGMGDRHTPRIDGTICHGTTDNPESLRQAFINSFADPPENFLVGGPRGATIRCQ
jgi:hypothetical protein